jgi:hypothetical protein
MVIFVMVENRPSEGTDLIDRAVVWLSQALPSTWTVERSTTAFGGGGETEPQRLDAAIDLTTPGKVRTTLAVEAKSTFTPRDAQQILSGLSSALRTLAGNAAILVISDWLSPRTQELLAERNVNYLDLTGNALIRVDNPSLYIRTQGATRNPEPSPRGRARVRGPKAARVVRLLVDVRPPYGVREIAAAAGVAVSYTSRLLDSLDREALIDRSPRGQVEAVDVAGLLRRWAESHDVFKANNSATFVAPNGVASVLPRLAQASASSRVVITGSFAATRLAPVAAPALLVAYCDDVPSLAAALDLLPADQGSNVALLRPYDSVVWDRTVRADSLEYVALSQTVIDCLSGTGRMPSEGEALLTWMLEDESRWRLASLRDLDTSSGAA